MMYYKCPAIKIIFCHMHANNYAMTTIIDTPYYKECNYAIRGGIDHNNIIMLETVRVAG